MSLRQLRDIAWGSAQALSPFFESRRKLAKPPRTGLGDVIGWFLDFFLEWGNEMHHVWLSPFEERDYAREHPHLQSTGIVGEMDSLRVCLLVSFSNVHP